MSKIRLSLKTGFTLIEVLLALSIIAIALTALLKVSNEDVVGESRLKEKLLGHFVQEQALTLLTLNMVTLNSTKDMTLKTEVFGSAIYWRAHIEKTPLKQVQKVIITISNNAAGPFSQPIVGFRRTL